MHNIKCSQGRVPQFYSLSTTMTTEQVQSSRVCPQPWLQNSSTVLHYIHHHDYRTVPQFYSLSTTMTTEQFHSSTVYPPPWLQNKFTVLQSVHHHDYRTCLHFYSHHHNYRTGPQFYSLSTTMTTEQVYISTVTTTTTEKVHSSTVCPPSWLHNRSTFLQSIHHHNYRTGPQFYSLSTTMTTEQV